MALIGEDEIRGFLDGLEREIGRAGDAEYGDLSIDGSISSRHGREEVSDIAGELPNVGDISLGGDPGPEDETRTRGWCERSLDQLELTAQLLDQCLDGDMKDLGRQQGIIDLCRSQIREMKARLN